MRSLFLLPFLAGLFAVVRAEEQPPEVFTSYGTYTATRVYESQVVTSPWLIDETTLVVWTVAETLTAQPEPTAPGVVPRAHARDFAA
ncbi:hypothetical protein OBBRIDRAFT_837274 [Obba rivulosa]|uniref:Uncharacterized protein n=1 Tax=Obba rivulosa TaxID=1052685 RepID=A0A8E2AQL0_9APHY|nr:hypothetical protein OBBRIDRAFT_837274 [Obba rivulosa]